jgi:virulence factor Mce-like protein
MKPGGLGAGRIAVMVLFAFSCFGLLLFLWLSFGGPVPLKPKGYRFQAAFPEATTLAEQADVRIAGVSVGKVVKKVGDPEGDKTLATIEIERKYAPIRSAARATLRQKTLLGETYVELHPGPKGAARIPEGGRLANARIEETVEFDEFLEIFPEETRRAFRRWQENGALVIKGRDQDLNSALGNLGPFAESGSDLLQVLDRRKGALGALVRETGVVFEALTEDEEALRSFMADTARWFQATQREKENLAESIRIFPTFLDESKATLARLETFSEDTNPLIEDLRPVAQDLQPTLRDLRRLSPDLRTFFTSLPALIEASEEGLPNLNAVLNAIDPTLAATGNFLAQLNPILQWLETSNGKVSDFLGIGPSALAGRRATQNPNGNGHVLPQLITTGSQSLLTRRRTQDNRGNTYLVQNQLFSGPGYNNGFEVNPNWDCNHVGEKKPTDTPGCFVAPPLPFKGKNERFPRIEADMTTATTSAKK